jgi:precorrin-8X/cobalt-precorrin-8 methylmutase
MLSRNANPPKMSGQAIEDASLAIARRLCRHLPDDPVEQAVALRIVHATGTPDISRFVRFRNDATPAARGALGSGASIYCDSQMVRSGLSLARLRQVNPGYDTGCVRCLVADPGVAKEASELGIARSVVAVRHAAPWLHGAIALFGNAPAGLLELCRLAREEGVRPALVVGMPVGFVQVTESKAELARSGLPSVILAGRRGGSPLAVAALHALCIAFSTPSPEGAA